MKIEHRYKKLKIEILAGAVIDKIAAEKRGFPPQSIERRWSENDKI